MRKMRRFHVFSIVAAMVMVMVLGCKFVPAQNNAADTAVEATYTSSAVFLNPDLA